MINGAEEDQTALICGLILPYFLRKINAWSPNLEFCRLAKCFNRSSLKAMADYEVSDTQKWKYVFGRAENGNKNICYQHFMSFS